MFSFRFDKAGFFSGLVLMCLLGGTLLATLLIVLIGGWNDFTILLLKWLWGTVWVLLIVTVLVRLAIYRYQMLHGINPHKREGGAGGISPAPRPDNPEGPPVRIEGHAESDSQSDSLPNPEGNG
jgi:hypothetical protein